MQTLLAAIENIYFVQKPRFKGGLALPLYSDISSYSFHLLTTVNSDILFFKLYKNLLYFILESDIVKVLFGTVTKR